METQVTVYDKKLKERHVLYGLILHPKIVYSMNNHIIGLTSNDKIFYKEFKASKLDKEQDFITEDDLLSIPNDEVPFNIFAAGDLGLISLKNGKLCVFYDGKLNISSEYLCARGFTCHEDIVAFICFESTIVYFKNGKEYKKTSIPDITLISACFSDNHFMVLTSTGVIYYSNHNLSDFKVLEINNLILKFFGFSSYVLVYTHDDYSFLLNYDEKEGEFEKVNVNIPYGFDLSFVRKFNESIICLDFRGRLAVGVERNDCISFKIKKLTEHKVSALNICSGYLLLFNGVNSRLESELSLPEEFQFLASVKCTINNSSKVYAFCPKYCYTSKSILTFDEFKKLIKKDTLIKYDSNSTKLYITVEDKIIGINDDPSKLFAYNFLPGDIVETPDKMKCKLVGSASNSLWLSPFNDRTVYSIENPHRLTLIERTGHKFMRVPVDDVTVTVDITPSFCEKFGYTLGDLYYVAEKGICEFCGLFCGKLVFFEFGNQVYFSSENVSRELLRTMKKNVEASRKIITSKGPEVVSVNSYGKIFLATDRVSTPKGVGTVVGFKNGKIYVQTDEMKMMNIGGEVFDIMSLRLVRRIGLPAQRQINIRGSEISVSLSTNDRVFDFFAGDRVLVLGQRATVVGVSELIYVHIDGKDPDEITVGQVSKLLYRADILGGPNCSSYEVGSPVLFPSVLLPDDLVKFKSDKKLDEYSFLGITSNGPIFINERTQEIYPASFTTLLMRDLFSITKRRSLII